MRRKLFTLAALLSLLLCIASAAMWVRSVWRGDLFTVAGQRVCLIRSEPGLIFVNISPAEPGRSSVWKHEAWPHASNWSAWSRLERRWWGLAGFGHANGFTTSGQPVDQFVVPYYCIVVVASLLPGLFLFDLLRKRRQSGVGRCRRCGYDLRATPNRCPECGTVPEVPQTP